MVVGSDFWRWWWISLRRAVAASRVRFWVSFGMGNYCCIWAFWPFEFCVVYCIFGHFRPLGVALGFVHLLCF